MTAKRKLSNHASGLNDEDLGQGGMQLEGLCTEGLSLLSQKDMGKD